MEDTDILKENGKSKNGDSKHAKTEKSETTKEEEKIEPSLRKTQYDHSLLSK